MDSAADRYIEFCKSSFPNYFSLRGLKIVVDCAHGATYHIAPKVFHELGAEIVGIGTEPSGFNINDKVGATYPITLQTAVLENQADYGLAFDGDGDRLIMVGRDGTIYNGDYLVYIMAKAKLKTGKLKGGVVGTVMTNMAMEIALTNQGIPFVRTQVGDRYIFEKLQTMGWFLGGEASGHILCLDKHTTGDGIISALQVFSALTRLNQDLSDITQDWKPFPQSTINVPVNRKDWRTTSKACILQAEKALANQGRIIIRPSGTEPVVRIMVEAVEESLALYWSNTIAQAILASK
jgi:phosphoglucosamine mutase